MDFEFLGISNDIKSFLIKRNKDIRELARMTDIPEGTLRREIQTNDFRISHLNLICEKLDLTMEIRINDKEDNLHYRLETGLSIIHDDIAQVKKILSERIDSEYKKDLEHARRYAKSLEEQIKAKDELIDLLKKK